MNSNSTGLQSTCQCNVNFTWKYQYANELSACFPQCFRLPYTKLIVGILEPVCVCIDGYDWNGSQCVHNCSSIPFANGSNGT